MTDLITRIRAMTDQEFEAFKREIVKLSIDREREAQAKADHERGRQLRTVPGGGGRVQATSE